MLRGWGGGGGGVGENQHIIRIPLTIIKTGE